MAVRLPDVLVADPTLLAQEEMESFTAERHASGTPLILYFPLAPEHIPYVLSLTRRQGAEIFLAGVTDTAESIRATFHMLPKLTLQARLLATVSPFLSAVPSRIAAAAMAALLDPGVSAKQIPQRVGVSRRTIERALQAGGCAPLRTWVVVARVTRAFIAATNPHHHYTDIVRTAGYQHSHSLILALQAVLGLHSVADLRSLRESSFLAGAAENLVLARRER